MTSIFENINVLVPLTEIMKFPYLKDKVEKFKNIQDESKDPPIVLKAMHYECRNEEHALFLSPSK